MLDALLGVLGHVIAIVSALVTLGCYYNWRDRRRRVRRLPEVRSHIVSAHLAEHGIELRELTYTRGSYHVTLWAPDNSQRLVVVETDGVLKTERELIAFVRGLDCGAHIIENRRTP